jgi:AAA ATPase domain
VYGRAFGFERAMDTLGAIVGPLSALLFLALWLGNYRVLLGVTLVPGIVAAGLIGFTVQENRRAPVHLLPVTYRRFLMAVGIFGVGAVAHTLLILLVTQRLTPSLGATAAGVAVPLYVLHNFFYAGFSYLGGLLADRFPKNLLLIGGYTLAGVRCLGVVFLPASIGSLRGAQRRFQLVFRRFIGVFARRDHPLALFLDDLQWLDAATLDFLENVLTQTDVHHLMLIGAYRDNEVNSAHPLIRKLETIRQAGAAVQEIILAPLACEDLGQLIADALHCELERATPLAQVVHDKTAGNPFFAIQFISALTEEALLTFDHGNGRWFWDLNRIHGKGYTGNVVDLMVGKLNRLPLQTQKVLQELACLGNSAKIPTLSIVHQTSEDELHVGGGASGVRRAFRGFL